MKQIDSPIAANLRRLRKGRSWTQEHLASAADLDVRTIQRAEGGDLLAAETLQAIAGALDISVTDPCAETPDFDKLQAEFDARHGLVGLTIIDRASELEPLLSASEAMYFQKRDLTQDAQEDAAAAFEQTLQDTVHDWQEIGPLERREAVKQLQAKLAALRGSGLVISAGAERRRLAVPGTFKHVSLTILYVGVALVGSPLRGLVYDKTAPISFA
jgi:transcriptional regulator with XRE-family HTH domain